MVRHRKSLKETLPWPLFAFVALVTVGHNITVGAFFSHYAGLVAKWADISYWRRSVVVVCAVGFALLLVLYRKRARANYGLTEIGVGICGIWLSCEASSATTAGLGIAASLYVMVRGADNYETGKAQDEATRAAAAPRSERELLNGIAEEIRKETGRPVDIDAYLRAVKEIEERREEREASTAAGEGLPAGKG